MGYRVVEVNYEERHTTVGSRWTKRKKVEECQKPNEVKSKKTFPSMSDYIPSDLPSFLVYQAPKMD